MANKYTDDDWLEELAGRGKYNNKDIGSAETNLLRKKLLSRHQILHKTVQTDSNNEIQQLTARVIIQPPLAKGSLGTENPARR